MRDRPPDQKRKGPRRRQSDASPNQNTRRLSTQAAAPSQHFWEKLSIGAAATALRDDGHAPIRVRLLALRASLRLESGARISPHEERELRRLSTLRRWQLGAAARLHGARSVR